ncbi:DUF6052 family protein [Actinomadura miaoliensis]|uniref:DUF6052 family protein n=1 Tax=Actinomadura miaoliensis TaxID=430685 RepID=UPI0031EF2CA3
MTNAEVHTRPLPETGARVEGELTDAQERQLLECYASLRELAGTCDVPSVVAAVRAALAELRVALYGQVMDFDFYDIDRTHATGRRDGEH